MTGYIKSVIKRIKRKRICKLNGYFCPDCIYREDIWEGITYRGNRCRYMFGSKNND